jgi:ribonuclease HI
MLTLQFDGLFRNAPTELHLHEDAGIMCYGWVILRNQTIIARGHGGYARTRSASSIVAEYFGLIEGMEALVDMHTHHEPITICGDAKSIIDQMNGNAAVAANSIKPLYRQAVKLSKTLAPVYWVWTPRKHNQAADALTRRALRQIRAVPHPFENAYENGRFNSQLRSLLDLRLYQPMY